MGQAIIQRNGKNIKLTVTTYLCRPIERNEMKIILILFAFLTLGLHLFWCRDKWGQIMAGNVWGSFGRGLSCFWARSDFNEQTLPAESATQRCKGYYEWAGSVSEKQTSPKKYADFALSLKHSSTNQAYFPLLSWHPNQLECFTEEKRRPNPAETSSPPLTPFW